MSSLGHGIGLRTRHYPHVLDGSLRPDWFEVIAENFLIRGGRPLAVLEAARALAPVVLHGVSMSLGGVDPLRADHLRGLRDLADRIDAAWVSDHLCWGTSGGSYAHDLLPLPFTDEAVRHTAGRIARVQDALGRRILIENVSSYVAFAHATMPEWDFVAAIAGEADCAILLDVNNVYVSARNHGFDAHAYLAGMPAERVAQIHLAGHSDLGTHLLDTHDGPVAPAVWQLYRSAVQRFGDVATLIEWDDHVPEAPVLLAEAEHARAIQMEVLHGRDVAA
jgi:uncharacterized protein (UPF0276 family)